MKKLYTLLVLGGLLAGVQALAQSNDPPANLVATAQSSTQIKLTWVDKSVDETGFEIDRSPDGRTNWQKDGSAGVNAVTYLSTGLSPNTRYFYRVRAVLPRNTYTAYATANTTTLAAPPVANDLTLAIKNGTTIELTWTVSGKEPLYYVERRLGASGRFERIGTGSGFYADKNLTPGQQYCYRVQYGESAEPAGYSNEPCITIPLAPSNIKNLKVTAINSSSIKLTWDRYGKESPIVIERQRGTSGRWEKIKDWLADAGEFTDTGLDANTQYCYRIGESGHEYSRTECETTPAPPVLVPEPPTNLVATALSSSEIGLSWTATTSTFGTGYRIEVAPSSGGAYATLIDLGNVTTYTHTGLSPNTAYCYRVRTRYNATVSNPSNEACQTTPPLPVTKPRPPSSLTASAESFSAIRLTWVDNSADESGFELERSTDGVIFNKIQDIEADRLSYTDNTVQPRTRYFYRILAKNSAGNSLYSNTAEATTPDGPPAAPTSLTATPTSATQVTLVWVDGSDNETGFDIERGDSQTGVFTKVGEVLADKTTYEDRGLTPAKTYCYQIKAKNATGSSRYSNVSCVTLPDVPPAAPARLTATATSPTQVTLAWADLATNESGFEIERGNSPTGAFTKIDEVTANVMTYEDRTVADNTTYCYRVRAKNAAGFSNFTEPVCATTPLAPPAAPTGLQAQLVDYDQVQLTWDALPAKAVTVIIERSTNPTAGFTEIRQQPAGQIGYVDVGLQEFTTYYYRIQAVNSAGRSGYSNVASARVEEIIIAVEDELATHTTLVVQQKTVHVSTNWYQPRQATVWLLTPAGQVMLTDHRRVQPADTWSYPLDRLPAGSYIISLIADGRKLAKRIVLP